MNIIADTNIFLAVALNEPEKAQIIKLTAGNSALAPEILPYEIGNALSSLVKRHRLSPKEAVQTFKAIQKIPVRLIRPNIQKALEIAFQFNLYAYDAYFIQCAQSLTCPIFTLDNKMKEAAQQLGITVLE
jgi:predicted nucleic acid-binding protein